MNLTNAKLRIIKSESGLGFVSQQQVRCFLFFKKWKTINQIIPETGKPVSYLTYAGAMSALLESITKNTEVHSIIHSPDILEELIKEPKNKNRFTIDIGSLNNEELVKILEIVQSRYYHIIITDSN